VSVWFSVGEVEKGCELLSSCPLHHDMVFKNIMCKEKRLHIYWW